MFRATGSRTALAPYQRRIPESQYLRTIMHGKSQMGFHGTGPAVQTHPSWGIPSTARQREPSVCLLPLLSLHKASAKSGHQVLTLDHPYFSTIEHKSQVERRRHGGLRGFVSDLVQRCRKIGNIPSSREMRPRKRNERSITASTSDGIGLRSYDSSVRPGWWSSCVP